MSEAGSASSKSSAASESLEQHLIKAIDQNKAKYGCQGKTLKVT